MIIDFFGQMFDFLKQKNSSPLMKFVEVSFVVFPGGRNFIKNAYDKACKDTNVLGGFKSNHIAT